MDDGTTRGPRRGDDPGATGPLWPPAEGDETRDTVGRSVFDDDESTSVLSPASTRVAGLETHGPPDPTRVAPDGKRDWLDEPLPQAPPPRVRAGRPRRRQLPPWPRIAAPVVFLVAVLCVFTLTLRAFNSSPGASTPNGGHPAATHKATTTSKSKYRIYVVKSGDTMSAIAVKYNTTIDVLLRLNPQASATTMNPGDRLRVPRQ